MRRLAAALAVLAASGTASAQTATPLDRFEPAPAGDTFVFVPSPDVAGGLRPTANIALSYASSPLVLVDTRRESVEIADVVTHQLALHGLVGFELFHRLKLELDVPVTLTQGGDSPSGGGITTISPKGAAMNDIRLGARVMLLEQHDYWPSVGASLTTWIPSGNAAAYTSSGSARLAPAVHIGADYGVFVWSAMVGRRFDTSDEQNLLGHELLLGAAAGPRVGPVLLSAEIWGSTVSQSGTEAFSNATTNVEAHLAARYDHGPLTFRIAGGPGLTTGVGTPDYRIVTMIGYAPEVLNPWERQRQYDRLEQVVSEPSSDVGTPASEPELGPQPRIEPSPAPDGDGDGVADRDDACVTVPGVRDADPKRDGCPADGDGDGIVDAEDTCPNAAGKRHQDPKKNGCPTSVRVVGEQILILDKIEFETGSAELRGSSTKILEQVADVMRTQESIVRLAIEGHTDNVGNEKANIALSQARAVTVMRWLIDHGVDERRLEARGYGPRQPLTENDSEEGRAKNRRVDFRIVKRSDRGAAAYTDGAVE